jgi:ABC-type uncharacterized transport system substrate-binding protein
MQLIGLAVVLALGLVLAPLAVEAQQTGKVYRIGILQTSAQKDEPSRVAALEQGLAELGYAGGRNIVLVNRNAGQQVGRLPEFATDLVRAGVDVIVTSTNPATLAAKQATATIPIVMTVGVEPVAAGLVASLAKPGANVTGLTFDVDATQLAAKRLEILKELMPSVSRVAVLWNPGYAPGSLRLKGTEQAGRSTRHHDRLGPLLREKRRGACVHRDPPSQGRGRHGIVRSGHRRTTIGHHRNGSAISGASDLRAARMGRGRRPHVVRNQPQ